MARVLELLVVAVVAALCGYYALRYGRRARRRLSVAAGIRRTPSTDVGDVGDAPIRVEGRIRSHDGPVTAPVSGVDYVAYQYDLLGKKNSGRRAVRLVRDAARTTLTVTDGTGELTVPVDDRALVSARRGRRTRTRYWRSVPERLERALSDRVAVLRERARAAREAADGPDLDPETRALVEAEAPALLDESGEPIPDPDPVEPLERYLGLRTPLRRTSTATPSTQSATPTGGPAPGGRR